MQKLLTKYWLALHLAVLSLAAWLSVLYPGMGMTLSLFWLSFFAVQTFVLLPSMLLGETMGAARLRACLNAVQDPFVYAGLALVIFACIQWLNSGCSLTYLDDVELWRYGPPPVGWLPCSVEPFPAFMVFALFAVGVIGGWIFRNGVGKAGKRFFLGTVSMFSGCVAIYMVVMSLTGGQPYAAWAVLPEGSSWGMCFGFWLLVALGGHLNFREGGFAKTLIWSFFSLLGNLAGLLQFGSLLCIILFGVVALFLLGYWMFFLMRQTVGGLARLKLLLCVAVAGVALFLLFYLFPGNPVKEKVAQMADAQYYETLLDGRRFQEPLAWRIWQDRPWTGVGASGFTHYSRTLIEESDWARLNAYGGHLSNDWLQFLTEYGIIGAGLLLGLLIVLLIPLFSRMRVFSRTVMSSRVGGSLTDLDPYVVSGIAAVALVLLLSFLFSPFQSGAMLVSFMYVLAVIPGFLPTGVGNK